MKLDLKIVGAVCDDAIILPENMGYGAVPLAQFANFGPGGGGKIRHFEAGRADCGGRALWKLDHFHPVSERGGRIASYRFHARRIDPPWRQSRPHRRRRVP